MIPPTKNLWQCIKNSTHYLNQYGIENAKREIEWFCKKTFQFSLIDIKSNKHITLTNNDFLILISFLKRRSQHEPFQYILNSAPFYNNNFYINPHVLIPRPETEVMIEVLKGKFFTKALDIGAGCGNIGITLCTEKIVDSVTLIDISEKALRVAKKNAELLNINNINFHNIDIFKYKPKKKYDLVVSNPPYIGLKEYNELPPHIKQFEPQIALTDCKDGYKFYKYLANHINDFLTLNGTMLLEIGLEETKDKIESFFTNSCNFIWHKDLNGAYRIFEINV